MLSYGHVAQMSAPKPLTPDDQSPASPASYDAMLVGFVVDWSGGTPTNIAGWTDIGPGMEYSATDIGRAQYRVYSSGTGYASFNGNAGDPCFVFHVFFIESAEAGGEINEVTLSDTCLVADGSPVQ